VHYYLGNGYITTSTLREILKALDDKLGPADLDGIIAEIDTDGSGTVDFDGKFLSLDLSLQVKMRFRGYFFEGCEERIVLFLTEFMEMMTGE
jgi:hypothetical protein